MSLTTARADPAANRPLVADPVTPSLPRITDTFENQPIRRSNPAGHTDTQPSDTDVGSTTLEVPRLIAALAAVIALIFFLRWIGQRLLGATPIASGTRAVQVLSRSLVAPRQSVMLMRIGRRLLVVADNGSQLASLSEITDPDEVAALVGQLQGEKLEVAGRTFGMLFGKARRDEATAVADGEISTSVSASASESQGAEPSDVLTARAELSGLMEQVRMASSQFSRQ